MTVYTLGQRVTVTDYLRRVYVLNTDRLAAAWPEYARLGNATRLWIPNSVREMLRREHDVYLAVDERYNPTPNNVAMPLNGVITRKLTISDGRATGDGYSSGWLATRWRDAYEVAYRITRRPLLVTVAMLDEISQRDEATPTEPLF